MALFGCNLTQLRKMFSVNFFADWTEADRDRFVFRFDTDMVHAISAT